MDSFSCPKCDFRGFPGFTLGASHKLVAECPKCQYEDPRLGPADFNRGIAVTGDGAERTTQIVATASTHTNGNGRANHVDAVAAAAFAGMTPPPMPAAPSKSPGDVIAWMEERNMWLLTEEARLAGELALVKSRIASVKAERRSLVRMLKVAPKRAADPSKN